MTELDPILQVGWDHGRFDNICDQLKPFLAQIGFSPAKISFVPCAAFSGENVAKADLADLKAWYSGPTLLEQLGERRSANLLL
jgi:elongation factor 1 alpha-like protein